MSSNHNWLQLVCVYINFGAVVYTVLVIVSDLGTQYGFLRPVPYMVENGTASVADVYSTPITPVSWVNITWLAVFGWMFLWSFHALISTCRTFTGIPVYVNPQLISTPLLLLSTTACATTVAWFCVFDREYLSTAALFSLSTTFLTWAAYVLSIYSLHSGLYRLQKAERMCEAWLHRFLVQNGLALLGTWSFLVTLLNLCTALIHNKDIEMDPDNAAVICLSTLAFCTVLVVILDVTVLDKFTRYTFLHYLVPVVVLCACIFRKDSWPSDDVVFIMLATLLTFSFLQIMMKAASVSCRLMASSNDAMDMSEMEGLTPHHHQPISAYTTPGDVDGDPYYFGK